MNLHNILNPIIKPKELVKKFNQAKPFPHIIIDDFLKTSIADRLFDVFPSHTEDFWWEYNNPIEKKLAYNKLEEMPKTISKTLLALNSPEFTQWLEQLTDIDNLQIDTSLNGGGMHCIKRNGKLDVHLDYSIHPELKLERRLNLIVYLNKDWKDEYGGCLELWDNKMQHCVEKIKPRFNRAVVFATGDESYHGHPEPLQCPDNISRKSLALYYLTEPRKNVTKRYRALFVARPQDDQSEELEEFRRQRSGLLTGTELYRKKGLKL